LKKGLAFFLGSLFLKICPHEQTLRDAALRRSHSGQDFFPFGMSAP
jgi:hypothetical protein